MPNKQCLLYAWVKVLSRKILFYNVKLLDKSFKAITMTHRSFSPPFGPEPQRIERSGPPFRVSLLRRGVLTGGE